MTTADQLADWVERSRAAQGLPPKVLDPQAVRLVARILAGTDRPVPHVA